MVYAPPVFDAVGGGGADHCCGVEIVLSLYRCVSGCGQLFGGLSTLMYCAIIAPF